MLGVSDTDSRAIKGINFALHRAKKGYLEATADWLVKTDISRFYPSIYTHSIPWAAYGKERVKAGLDFYKGSFADRLDLLVRSCNRNQTIRLPIGPETSRIIAEIISSRIDSEFVAIWSKLESASLNAISKRAIPTRRSGCCIHCAVSSVRFPPSQSVRWPRRFHQARLHFFCSI